MERGDIITLAFVIILWGTLIVSCIQPIPAQQDEYLHPEWLFEAPFNITDPVALENTTPPGTWLHNITIPYINGTTNQYWYRIEDVTIGDGYLSDLWQNILTLELNTSLFSGGWVHIHVYAHVLPAWMHGSSWYYDRWVYLGH